MRLALLVEYSDTYLWCTQRPKNLPCLNVLAAQLASAKRAILILLRDFRFFVEAVLLS